MAGGEGDANLHLTRVVLPTVQTAIAHHALRRLFDNRQLKPRPRNTRLTVALTFDEACRVVRPERLPPLVPCHLRQRTIAVQRCGIATLQPAKEKSRRRQRVWKDLAHDVTIETPNIRGEWRRANRVEIQTQMESRRPLDCA